MAEPRDLAFFIMTWYAFTRIMVDRQRFNTRFGWRVAPFISFAASVWIQSAKLYSRQEYYRPTLKEVETLVKNCEKIYRQNKCEILLASQGGQICQDLILCPILNTGYFILNMEWLVDWEYFAKGVILALLARQVLNLSWDWILDRSDGLRRQNVQILENAQRRMGPTEFEKQVVSPLPEHEAFITFKGLLGPPRSTPSLASALYNQDNDGHISPRSAKQFRDKQLNRWSIHTLDSPDRAEFQQGGPENKETPETPSSESVISSKNEREEIENFLQEQTQIRDAHQPPQNTLGRRQAFVRDEDEEAI